MPETPLMQDTDRELLELAAKAAGLPVEWHHWPSTSKGCHYLPTGDVTCGDGIVYATWNPLTDDGDALRLAVALGLEIGSSAYSSIHVFRRSSAFASEDSHPDPLSATRRAIVRAAAQAQREREAGR